jgi:transposase-like protein
MEHDDEFEAPTQEDVRTDLRTIFLDAIRTTMEALLVEEVREMVGVQRGRRGEARKDYRNGSYQRGLLTSMGRLDLTVPRTRHGGAPVGVLGRYARRTEDVDSAIVSAYVNGVSTRKLANVTESLMGESVSKATVSRVTKSLEAKVESLKKAPIEGPFPYLYLDATFLDARWARTVENVSALVAYGVGADGHRSLLGITIGAQESEASWSDLLEQLNGRGLSGVRLAIADGHAGLAAAIRKHLPEAELQRCTVHLERNVLTKTPRKLRGRLAREVSKVFNAPTLADAKKHLTSLKIAFGKIVPEAIECLDQGFAAATRFFAFPQAHWVKIRSNNGLERLHGEIKRRIRAVGAFPDRASALRLITAVALEVTNIWNDRRYLDMSLLETAAINGKEENAA